MRYKQEELYEQGKRMSRRGERAERIVHSILRELFQEKMILGFEDCTKMDGSPDFKVLKLGGSTLPFEVKTSSAGEEEHRERYPDIQVVIVYPFWAISMKFRKFSPEKVRKDVKRAILSLL